jgi:hypothetical protein
MTVSKNLRIALLIDGDNAQPSLIQPILDAVSAVCVHRGGTVGA